MVGRPLWIDVETEQVIQPLHFLAQDPFPRLDAAVGFRQGFQSHDRFRGHLGAFVFAQGEAVVAFEGDANFVKAGHGLNLQAEP